MINYDTAKIEFIFEINRQKWVSLKRETGEITVVEKEFVRKYFYKILPQKEFQLAIKTLFLDLPMVHLEYNPNRENEWISNNLLYKNTFFQTEIYKKVKKQKSKNRVKYNKNFDFLAKYPFISALFKNLAPIQQEREYVLNWLSTIFNNQKKIGTAILFKGEQGTGKGVLYEQIISYFYGENNCITLSNEDISSKFTRKKLDSTIFILANEIKGDFRTENTIYEKLKTYITDNSIRIEEKGIQSREVKSYFNMMFFSNNQTPLQIQGGDRRYSVVDTKNRKLNLVAMEDFNIDISSFISKIRDERDAFLLDLCMYSYDSNKAKVPLENDSKNRIYRASMTKIEILADAVKNVDKNFFTNDLVEVIEMMENNDRAKIDELIKKTIISKTRPNSYTIDYHLTFADMFTKIEERIKTESKIDNSILLLCYKIFVNNADSSTKIGISLSSYFSKSKTDKNGKNRYRIVK